MSSADIYTDLYADADVYILTGNARMLRYDRDSIHLDDEITSLSKGDVVITDDHGAYGYDIQQEDGGEMDVLVLRPRGITAEELMDRLAEGDYYDDMGLLMWFVFGDEFW